MSNLGHCVILVGLVVVQTSLHVASTRTPHDFTNLRRSDINKSGPTSSCICHIDVTRSRVNCSSLGLSRVPDCVPNDTVVLHLEQNSFQNITRHEFQRFSRLQELYLDGNAINELNNDAFTGLVKLTGLSLSRNNLQRNTSFGDHVFKPLTSLRRLWLQGNCNSRDITLNCSYPENALANAATVEYLHIDGTNVDLGHGFSALKNLQRLVMSGEDVGYGHCYLKHPTETTFAALASTPVNSIYLYDCNMRQISPNVFRSLWNLSTLDIRYNRNLCYDAIANATAGLNGTKIVTLRLTNWCRDLGKVVPVNGNVSTNLNSTSLETLDLSGNMITYVDPSFVTHLPRSLESVCLRDNRIGDAHFIEEFKDFDSMKVFDISYQNYNSMLSYNQTVEATVESADEVKHNASDKATIKTHKNIINMFSRDKVIAHTGQTSETNANNTNGGTDVTTSVNNSTNGATNVTTGHSHTVDGGHMLFNHVLGTDDAPVVLPKNIDTILLSNLKLKYPVPPLVFSENKLRYVDVSNCLLLAFLGPWKGLDYLEFLNLSYNKFDVIASTSFSYMNNLITLLLQGNQVGKHILYSEEMFSGQKKLKVLNLTDNIIKQLPRNLFHNQQKLETLLLADNALTSLDVRLDYLTSLKELDLSNNEIQSFSSENMKFLDTLSETAPAPRINLSGNILPCTCENREMINWLLTTKVEVVNVQNLTCRYQNNTILTLDRISQIHEQLFYDCTGWFVVMACIVGFTLILLVATLVAVLYQKRWTLRYLYNVGRNNLHPYHPLEEQHIDLDIDVYISYDRDFIVTGRRSMHDIVAGDIYRYLETEGFVVKIREELTAGRSLNAVISEVLRTTRKMVVLLTAEYCRDYWNTFEFNMAALEGIYTKRSVIIPVIVGDVNNMFMSPEIEAFVKTKLQTNEVLYFPERFDRERDYFLQELALRLAH